jgi:hypothetical protein
VPGPNNELNAPNPCRSTNPSTSNPCSPNMTVSSLLSLHLSYLLLVLTPYLPHIPIYHFPTRILLPSLLVHTNLTRNPSMFSLPPTYQPEASSSCLASPPSFPPYPSDPFSEHTAIRISDLEAIVNTSSLSPSFNSTDSDESDATSALLLLSSPSSVNAYDETSTTSPPSRPLSTPRPVIYDENDARSTRLRERGYTSAYYCWHRVDIEAWHHAPISTSIDPALYNFWFFGERAVRKEGQLDKKIIVNWNEFANGRSVYDIIAPQRKYFLSVGTGAGYLD